MHLRRLRSSDHVLNCEALESRALLHGVLLAPLPDVTAIQGDTAAAINLNAHFDNTDITGTVVRFTTTMGDIDVALTDADTPITVANFLNYVNSGRYNNTIFHRSFPNFILHGGGYNAQRQHIPIDAPIQNEASPSRSNLRGTIAMARASNDPNSATSEWFFNLTHNGGVPPDGLDYIGGGVTVFGRIINNGMDVVDAINALPREDFQGQAIMPVNNGQPVVVTTVGTVAEMTYTATSDNPDVVVPTMNGSTLSYNALRGGVANITVMATSLDGQAIVDTFTVNVTATEADITLGNGGARSITFTDADGTVGTFSVGGGSATLRFTGSTVIQEATSRGITVNGTGVVLESITFTGASDRTTLSLRALGGNESIDVPNIAGGIAVDAIDAKKGNLTGTITLASIRRLHLGQISGGSIVLTDPNQPLASAKIGQATDATFSSAGPVGSFRAGAWADVVASVDAFVAKTIEKLTVPGAFGAALTLTGGGDVLASARLGEITGRTWHITGNVERVTVDSTATAWDLIVTGDVGSLTINNEMRGGLFASSIASLRAGSIVDSDINITASFAPTTRSLGRVTAGSITGTELRSSGNIGSIRVATGVASSFFYVGLNNSLAAPLAPADFNHGAVIRSIRIGPAANGIAFADSGIAASTLRHVELGAAPDVASPSQFFGVAADRIGIFSATIGGKRVRLTNIETQAQANAALAADDAMPMAFVLRLV